MKDSFVQQAGFPQAYQRGDGEFFVTGGADKMVAAVAELLTVLANVVFDFRTFWPIRSVETIHTASLNQIIVDPVKHDVRHFAVSDALIAIIAVLIMLMQINIVQAGAAVEDAVIDNKAFEMENAERLPGVNRHAVNGDLYARIFSGHPAIPVGVGVGGGGADTATLSAVPVHEDANIQLRTLTLGVIQGLQNSFSAIILLQVERNNAYTLSGVGNPGQ